MKIAQDTNAIAFDTPGAGLDHQDNLCTFDVIIKKYELTDKVLLRMARIINAVDTGRLKTDSLTAEFEAIAVGYSLRFPGDFENIEKQCEVYDALYAWCRLDVARDES